MVSVKNKLLNSVKRVSYSHPNLLENLKNASVSSNLPVKMASDNETSCVCDPNFAVICSFLEKFAKSCGISHPNILELQEMLENSQEVPQPLVDLHVKLLRKARKSVSGERWEKAIIKFCHSYSNQDGWEIERFGYKKARISVKLRILKMLLELQFDLNTKFKTEVNRLSADELRCQPLGRDKMGQTYWCQLDEDCNLRVYREDLDDETWEVVARDRDGLVQLISQLSSNDPFRKDTEEILNEDSNSLEIEKPITDTGQVITLQKGVVAESVDDDDDEEFQEIDDEESEEKDDIPSHGNIDKSCAADEDNKQECNVEKKEFEVKEQKPESKEKCTLKPVKTEETEINPEELSECTLKETEPAQKFPEPKGEFKLNPEEVRGENMMEPSKPEDHLLQSLKQEKHLLKLEESKNQCGLKPTVHKEEEQQHTLDSAKSKEENVIKTTEFKERETKPAKSKEENAIKMSESKEKEILDYAESKEENVTKIPEPKEKEMLESAESKEEIVIKIPELKDKGILESAELKEENVMKTTEPKEKEMLNPADSKEQQINKKSAIIEKEILKLAASKEENVIKITEFKDKEVLKSGDRNEGSLEQTASEDNCTLKIAESNEREIHTIESKDLGVCTPVESESIGEELKHAKFKEASVKNDELTNKHVLKITDNVNHEIIAKAATILEDSQNRFSSVDKDIERRVPRALTNNPSQSNIPQNEFVGMDLSKSSQPRVLEPPISKNIGIDLTSKSYIEEHSLQQQDKIEDMNESSTSNSSLVAEDLSDASKRTQSNSETFDHKRFVPHPLTATDLSTKRSVDLIKSSKVTIMNSMQGFGSLSVSRLNLSGKRLHESDLMTNEAKKLRLEQTVAANCHKLMPPIVGPPLPHFGSGSFDSEDSAEVGEAIEEPLMLVRGEGSGADCNTGNPGKEGENGKDNNNSSKNDEISAGGGAGQAEKSAVFSDHGKVSTGKEETSGKGPEISNQETRMNPMRTSSTSKISDISDGSTVRREGNLSEEEKLIRSDVQVNCEKSLSVEKLLGENERCSDLNTKKTNQHGENQEDNSSSGLEISCEAKKILDPVEHKEKSSSSTNKTLCLDKHSSKEESFVQSPPKHSPKLWSIETICAPDGKSKDNPKTGSGSTKLCGNSFLGVVSDSLYGEKYSAKFQDVESGGRINPSGSSPTKRPSRWDVGGDDRSQKKDQSESNDKSSILQNASSTAADTSQQKMDKLLNTNLGPVTEEQTVAIDLLPAVEVSRPSKNISESGVQVCQKQKFKFDIENIITIVEEKEKTKPPLISTFDVKANTYIDKLQIAGAVTKGTEEGATPEKETETLECGIQECRLSEQNAADKDGAGDTNANLEKLPSQGFFFGPGCLLKSPIKKTSDGIASSNSKDSVKTDVEGDSSKEQTHMSALLSEQTNKVITESVSEMFDMKDQKDLSEICAKCPKTTACAASSSPKSESPAKGNTLHSIDTIMSTHKLKEFDIPQPTVSCMPFSAEASSMESLSFTPEKSGDHENPQLAKEACSDSQLKGMELVSSRSCSETLEDKVNKLSRNEQEERVSQLFSKEKTNEKGSVKPVFEGSSSITFGEKHAYSVTRKESGKNVSSAVKKSGLQSKVDVKTEGDTAGELSKTCLSNDDDNAKKCESETSASGENTSECAQSDRNGKSLENKNLSPFSEKRDGFIEEKKYYNDGNREGTSDSNKKTSVETSDLVIKEYNTKERSTENQHLITVNEDREKVPTYAKIENKGKTLNISFGNEDQNARAMCAEVPAVNKSKQEIGSAEGKEIVNKISSLPKKTEVEAAIECMSVIPSSEEFAGKLCKGKKSDTLNEEPHSSFTSSQNKGISNASKHQAEVKEQKLETATSISLTQKDDVGSPKNHSMNETSSATKACSDQKLRDHISSSYVKNLNSLVQKPLDSSTSPNDLKKNIIELVKLDPKEEPKIEDKPVISVLAGVPSTSEKSIKEHEDRLVKDPFKAEIPLDLGKCIEIDTRNEAKMSEKINLNTLLDASKPKHENIALSVESKSELPRILQLPEKTTVSKNTNVLKVDKVKSSSPINVALKHIEEETDNSEKKSIPDPRIKDEEKKTMFDMKLGKGISSVVSESKLSHLPSVKGSQCMKSQAPHSEAKTEKMFSYQLNPNSGRDDSKNGSDCIISNVEYTEKTEIITSVSAISKSSGKFPEKPSTQSSSNKFDVETCIGLARKAETEILNVSVEKTVGKSNTIFKKKADIKSTMTSVVQMKPTSSSSQSQQKSIDNTSQIEIKSSLDACENKTFPINESEIASKTSHIESKKPENEHAGEYCSETVSHFSSKNKSVTTDDPTQEFHENASEDGVKNKSLSLTGMEAVNNSIKVVKQHNLVRDVTLPFSADNKQGKTDACVLSEAKIDSTCPTVESCETKTSSIATPQIKGDLMDNLEDNNETKKIVISAEKVAIKSDNFTKHLHENISNVPKDEIQSKSEKICHVKEADISLPIPVKTINSSGVVEDPNTQVEKGQSALVEKEKDKPLSLHGNIKCTFDSSDEIKTEPAPCLISKNKSQVENVSKKVEPILSQAVSDNNSNKVCSAKKCETNEKTEKKSLLSGKVETKISELDKNTINSSLKNDDSKVSANKKEKNEPRKQNRGERADDNLHLKEDVKNTINERHLPVVSPLESEKNPLQKSVASKENKEMFRKETQPNVEKISSIEKEIMDISSVPEKALLKNISESEKKVIKHDMTEKSLDVEKLVSENVIDCNNSNVMEKNPDMKVQKEEELLIVPQEKVLKKKFLCTIDPNISHIPKNKDTTEIVPDLIEDGSVAGGKTGSDLLRQKVENVGNQKITISSKAEEETVKSSQSETEKTLYSGFSERSPKNVGEDKNATRLDVCAGQKRPEVSLNKNKSRQNKGESAQALLKETSTADDKNHEKSIPKLNIALVGSDDNSSEKIIQNIKNTEISKSLPSADTEVTSSFPVTSAVQNITTVDEPLELQSPSKESVKSVASKSLITKPSTISCKVKNDLQNKGRRKSLESISMGIMMGKVAAKSSLQEPVNAGDGSLLEEISKHSEESAPNQIKLAMPSASCQGNESPVKFESPKVCIESDKVDTSTSEPDVEGSEIKVTTQETLKMSQLTEQVAKFESSTEQLSEKEGVTLVQPVTVLEKKGDLFIIPKTDVTMEADHISNSIKKTEEAEEKEATELVPQKEASIELKRQDIPRELDDTTTYPKVAKTHKKDEQGSVSTSSEKLETEDCKNAKSTENKLGNDNLVPKETRGEDPSKDKDSSSITLEVVESPNNAQTREISNTFQLSDIQKLTVNKRQEETLLLKETVVADDKIPSDTNDPQHNSSKAEVVKPDNSVPLSTESHLEETISPKVDISDMSVTEPKDLQATEQSSEEDVANDDSCYILDNDSVVDQESDEIKSASSCNQKRGQTDEEIPKGKRSRVEESLVLDETGGASSSEGEQGGEPDGSSDDGESEAGAVGKRGGSVTQTRRKSGRGRRGRGRGSRGRSRAQRVNTGKSASPVLTGASEDDKREAEPFPPITPAKTKAIRGKRAPKLMGLDLGVDIVLEQSRGDEEGRPGAPPVRQSRRIAQMKIREEAERRKLEEMTLQQLKEEQSRRRADARAEKKELKEGKKRKKKAVESDEDFTAEEVDEEASSKKKMKKKKRRKKKPALSFNESNPWQSSSGSSTSQEEDEEGEQSEEEEDDEELIFKSDHEFSPESDLENDDTEVAPMRRARTAQKGLPCEDEEQFTDEHACQKCGKSDHPEWILLCDKCDSGWHCSCLRPALMVIPEGDWFCPPCEHTFLLENLHNNLLEFDRNWKRRENEELRRKRLAYVGISLDNVLPNKEGSGGESDTEMKKEPVAATPTGSEVSGSESGTSSEEDSEPVYQLRQRRQTLFSYRFNEYDDLINSAIQDEMEAVKGAGNQGRGKDIATIVKAEAEAEAVAQAQAQEQVQTEEMQSSQKVTAISEECTEKVEEKEEPISEEMEKEELPPVVPKHDIKDEEEEEEDEFCPFKKFQIRKKHRRLNSLDISSEDDAESDEDFKGTSSEDDEDEYEGSEGESEDSEFRGRRGKGSRRRVSGPVRRSSRARITRFDKEFINDDSEDSEPPKKKSRKLWQDSDSEESDASWRRSKRSKKQVTTFKTVKTKGKKKKKKRSKRDGDSDLEVYRAKKPKIKYGGLEEDEISPTRRTRGRKINYQELAASDSEEETWGRLRKLESEDEYIANEEDEEEEEDEVLPDQEKESENESGELTEMKKANRAKQDKKTKPRRVVKSGPEKFVRKGKRGTKTNKKVIIDSEEDIPPCTGVQVPSENEDPTFGLASHQSVNTQTSEAELLSCSVVNVPIGNLPKERKGRTRGQGKKQEEQKKKGKRKKKNENASLDFTEGLAPGFQNEKGDGGLLGKQLADVQLLPAQSRMGAEISVKGGETLMQRLTAAGRTVPLSLGSNPDLLPEADRAMLLQSAKGPAETDPLRSLLAAPPVIPSDGDLKVSDDVPLPAGKRKGRGRGKAAAAKAADVSHYPLQNYPQSGSGIGNTSSSSVITRMLQSQPVSGTPQSFTAAATAMGHKYFGSTSGEPSLMPMQNAGRGTSSVPPYSGPPKGLSSPYRPPPPTDTNNSGLGPGMGHYGSSPSTRGSGIRGPPGFQQTGSMRLRNPPPSGQPHMFHTSHHPMDPSPSGGGPIIISSAAAPPPPPAGSPHNTKPGTPSGSQNTPTPPPPPPYSRPGSQLPLVPPTSTTMASMMQFPSQPGDSSQPPVRHPPPPFPPSTSASHLQTSQGTPQSSPPTHQGRSPVPGNFSPYHPPPPANYHYGGYPPPPPMSAADDALPPSAFQGSPYTDHYTSSDMTANLQASDGSNSKSYDEEGGGEFGGLVSYFSSQREDDLDT